MDLISCFSSAKTMPFYKLMCYFYKNQPYVFFVTFFIDKQLFFMV